MNKHDSFISGLRFNKPSCDAEEMREQSVFWSYEHKQYGKGIFKGEITAYHTKRLQLTLADRSVGFFARGGLPVGTTIISFPLLNPQTIHYRGSAIKECQALALNQNEEFEIFTTFPTLMLTIAVDNSLLARQTLSIRGMPFETLRNQDRLTVNSDEYRWRIKRLTSFLNLLMKRTGKPDEAEEQAIETEILETVLLGAEPAGVVPKPADRLFRAKKAEEYIRNNLSNPITIESLCRYSGTAGRTLHLGFKERFGVTPKAYLRIMRLNRVRKDLRDSNNRKTISLIAKDSGFSHLGHFTEEYRRMFGETPTNTREKASLTS